MGVPVGAGLTVAVNVTCCPATTGFGEAVSRVVVEVKPVPVTISVNVEDVEPANVALPEYAAVMEFAPKDRLLVVNVATPAEFTVTVPSNVAP